MLAVLIEVILEFLAEVVFEIILQSIVEVGFYKSFQKLKIPFRNSVVIEATGYVIVGAMLGGASVLVFPNSFIGHTDLQVLNLILTPIAAGLAMMGIGAIRRHKGQEPIRLDSFAFGALFAFSLEFVRFLLVN